MDERFFWVVSGSEDALQGRVCFCSMSKKGVCLYTFFRSAATSLKCQSRRTDLTVPRVTSYAEEQALVVSRGLEFVRSSMLN